RYSVSDSSVSSPDATRAAPISNGVVHRLTRCTASRRHQSRKCSVHNFRELIEAHGYKILTSANAAVAGSLSARQSLDNPDLHAPSPELVIAALKAWQNTPENLPDHDDFVAAIAAIKAALGPRREEFYPEVEEWGLDFPGNTHEYVRKVWDS